MRTLSPEDQSLSWEISDVAGHCHATCFNNDIRVNGSGFATVRETAKKKAHAELNERLLVRQLLGSGQTEDWGLNFDNSCSGFAVGYLKSKSQFRALAEGIERWTLSRWVDHLIALPQVSLEQFDTANISIRTHFDSVTAYLKCLPVYIDDRLIKIYVAVILGWKDNGVFAGYGAKLNEDDAIAHAHVEALRNLVIFRNQPERAGFPYERIRFFAENAGVAHSLISKMREGLWPVPRLRLTKTEQFGSLWLSRAIFNDWTPWQFGSNERFLY